MRWADALRKEREWRERKRPLPVDKAIAVLRQNGWTYEGSTKISGIRAYQFTSPDGHVHYLTTYGLRHQAAKHQQSPVTWDKGATA